MRSVPISEASASFEAVSAMDPERRSARIRSESIEEFTRICDEIAKKAQARGLTEDELAEILQGR